ncbi:MAG: PTS sugar transporter subunit IIA [Victivallaceae bacterium]|nr:PTS sugar transporter subunit IIA [Victivallaceae bacterium]
MKLASLLNPHLVFCRLSGSTREEIYGGMLDMARTQMHREHLDTKDILAQLIERENFLKMPYCGIALPHVRLEQLHDLYIVIGVPAEPVMLKDDDTEPTKLVVMSLISESTSNSYLKALAAFARYLTQPGKLDALTACNDGQQLVDMISNDCVTINRTLTAEDLMLEYPTIRADQSLAEALDTFYRERREVLPVVDADNHFLGLVDAADIIRSFIPDYLLMLDNLNFLNSFEVFDNIFKSENKYSVRDYVQPAKMILAPDTPLIQFTIRLVRREAYAGFVVDSENHLLGVVAINNIVHKVLRG